MPKTQKMITVAPKPPKAIKPLKHLPVPTCYIRRAFVKKQTGTVVRQTIVCKKKI